MDKVVIYKQDAIDAIRRLPNAGMHWFIPAEAVFKVLSEMPPAPPKQCADCIKHGGDWECDHIHCRKGQSPTAEPPWIPFEKEKPKDGQETLVSTKFGKVYKSTYSETEEDDPFGINEDIVIAWMPYPAPYKVKKEG